MENKCRKYVIVFLFDMYYDCYFQNPLTILIFFRVVLPISPPIAKDVHCCCSNTMVGWFSMPSEVLQNGMKEYTNALAGSIGNLWFGHYKFPSTLQSNWAPVFFSYFPIWFLSQLSIGNCKQFTALAPNSRCPYWRSRQTC